MLQGLVGTTMGQKICPQRGSTGIVGIVVCEYAEIDTSENAVIINLNLIVSFVVKFGAG